MKHKKFILFLNDLKTFCAEEKKISMETLKHLEKFHRFIKNSGDFPSLSGHVGYPPPAGKKISLQIWMIQSMYEKNKKL